MNNDARTRMVYEASRKDIAVAYLLWFFVPWAGGHRFYLGRTGSALGQIGLAAGGLVFSAVLHGLFLWTALGIWILVDAFLIPGMVREYNKAVRRHL